jgi:transposase InsO family protein
VEDAGKRRINRNYFSAQACRRFRLLRTRVRLGERARETLEAELARLLRELNEPAAPAVGLLLPSVRQG